MFDMCIFWGGISLKYNPKIHWIANWDPFLSGRKGGPKLLDIPTSQNNMIRHAFHIYPKPPRFKLKIGDMIQIPHPSKVDCTAPIVLA